MRVLMVEGDELFGSTVHASLAREGYAVDWLRKGQHVNAALQSHHYDCILLDLGLPDVNGESVVAAIRQQEHTVSVIVTSADGTTQDRVRLLDVGADDYMRKPLDLGELGARVRAVSRRATPAKSREDIEYGALRLCRERRSATWRDRPVPVTFKEYSLLEAFLRRERQVLTRAQLAKVLYGWEDQVESNAVEVYIHSLRRKFGRAVIQTVRGLGYQLGERDAMQ